MSPGTSSSSSESWPFPGATNLIFGLYPAASQGGAVLSRLCHPYPRLRFAWAERDTGRQHDVNAPAGKIIQLD
jgi:hypothetical protein